MSKCECKSQEQNKETLENKLKEFEQLKANVSFLAGQIALLQELEVFVLTLIGLFLQQLNVRIYCQRSKKMRII